MHRVGAVHVRPQLHVGPVVVQVDRRRRARCRGPRRARRRSRPRCPARAAARSASLTTSCVSTRCGEHVTYATTPPGRTARSAETSRSRCSALEPGQVGRRAAPARLRPTAQRAEAGARRVDHHAVVGARLVACRPSARRRSARPRPRRRAPRAAPARPAGCGAAGPRWRRSARRAPRRRAASSAALPPGPAHRSSQRSSGPSSGASASASATSWLPSSCTPARPSRTLGSGRRVAAGEDDRRRARARRARPPRVVDHLVVVGEAGARDERHAGRHVVGDEQRARSRRRTARCPPAPRAAPGRPTAGGSRPRRAGRAASSPAAVGDPLLPRLGRLPPDRAQHGVDELRRPRAQLLAREADRLRHRGVRRDAHPEQLVRRRAAARRGPGRRSCRSRRAAACAMIAS